MNLKKVYQFEGHGFFKRLVITPLRFTKDATKTVMLFKTNLFDTFLFSMCRSSTNRELYVSVKGS